MDRDWVYLIDDDDAIRRALRRLLQDEESVECQDYADAQHFLDVAPSLHPGCAVVDLYMPGLDGLSLLEALQRRNIYFPSLVLTAYGDVDKAVRAMRAGALDFMEKPVEKDAFRGHIRRALREARVINERRAQAETAHQKVENLTMREQEVLILLAEGKSNKQVASTLDISPRTAELHRARIMDKLENKSLAGLVRIALDAGLLGEIGPYRLGRPLLEGAIGGGYRDEPPPDSPG